MSGPTAWSDDAVPRLVLYTRTGCHLCVAAADVVAQVSRETGTAWTSVDVDDAPDLVERYGELVPAVTVDGVMQGYWRLDGERLRRALASGGTPTHAEGG